MRKLSNLNWQSRGTGAYYTGKARKLINENLMSISVKEIKELAREWIKELEKDQQKDWGTDSYHNKNIKWGLQCQIDFIKEFILEEE